MVLIGKELSYQKLFLHGRPRFGPAFATESPDGFGEAI